MSVQVGTPVQGDAIDDALVRVAIDMATASAGSGGGPFGAIVVRDGDIIGRGNNQVTASCDPTAHAEVVAIREAARLLATHDLSGCVLYTSCEPCPMCLGAAWWSRVDRVVFAATRQDAAAAGFDDEDLYQEVSRPLERRQLAIRQVGADDANRPFEAWAANEERIEY